MVSEARRPKPHELAKSMGVTLRTILRDLNTLEQIGIPLRGDESGRRTVLELAPGNRGSITVLPFTVNEAVALLWASMPSPHNLPFIVDLHNAARKLRYLAQQSEAASDLTKMSQVVVSTAGPLPARVSTDSTLTRLIGCSLSGIRCRIQFAGSDPEVEWNVEPLFILNSAHEPFLVGRRDGVLFSVPTESITHLSETKARFDPPGREWILKTSQSWFSTQPGSRMKVVVRFSAGARHLVEGFAVHPTQETVVLPDGRTEVRFAASGGLDIVQWALGWGDAVEVVAPLSLRTAVREKLAAALVAYKR